MSNVSVYNMEGNEVGTLELNDAVFGVEVNEHLVHMAVVRQLANKRQGTQKAKTPGFIGSNSRIRCQVEIPASYPAFSMEIFWRVSFLPIRRSSWQRQII